MDTNEKIKAVRTAARMLELPDEFDENTLRKAYKQFARNWHPDAAMQRGLSAENANKMMAEGNKAYQLLRQCLEENGGYYRVPEECQAGGETNSGYSGTTTGYGGSADWQSESKPRDEYQNPYANYSEPDWHEPGESAYSSGRTTQNRRGSEPAASSSVIVDMFRSIREPTSYVKFWEAKLSGKILRLVVHGFGLAVLFLFLYCFADLTLPLDELTFDALYVSLLKDVILLPAILIILGLAYVGVWVYRGIARFVLDLGDSSSLIALILNVVLIVAMAFVSRPYLPLMRQAVDYVFSLIA